MMVWETDPNLAADSPLTQDFAPIWQAATKIVYSKSLEAASTRNTQIERNFYPEAIKQLKKTVQDDILIGGPELAAHAFPSRLRRVTAHRPYLLMPRLEIGVRPADEKCRYAGLQPDETRDE